MPQALIISQNVIKTVAPEKYIVLKIFSCPDPPFQEQAYPWNFPQEF